MHRFKKDKLTPSEYFLLNEPLEFLKNGIDKKIKRKKKLIKEKLQKLRKINTVINWLIDEIW